MVTPITPQELKARRSQIPDFVIDVFNDLIAENFDGRSAVILQEDVVKRLLPLVQVHEGQSISPNARREMVFKKGWLNVEALFEKQGWKVAYYKPDYREDGYPSFTFTAP